MIKKAENELRESFRHELQLDEANLKQQIVQKKQASKWGFEATM